MNSKKELYFQALNFSVLFVFVGILFVNYVVFTDNNDMNYWVLLVKTLPSALLYVFWLFSILALILLLVLKNFRNVLLPVAISVFVFSFVFVVVIKIIWLTIQYNHYL